MTPQKINIIMALPEGGERLSVIKIFVYIIIFLSLFYRKNINEISPICFYQNNFNLYKTEKVFIQNDNLWFLTIPKINLKDTPIKDGITNDILENYIGHFPITAFVKGNICLAAHNNGYENNYFNRINELEVGDEINYHYFNIEKKYSVYEKNVIDERDFLSLNESNEDTLTLITCIDNSPSKRLCIKAICKE